jgi:hypothetical protein
VYWRGAHWRRIEKTLTEAKVGTMPWASHLRFAPEV